jgi:hypothetical protein
LLSFIFPFTFIFLSLSFRYGRIIQDSELRVQSGGAVTLIAGENTPERAAGMRIDEAGVRFDAERLTVSHGGQQFLSVDADLFRVDSAEALFSSTAGLLVQGTVQTAEISSVQVTGNGLTLESVAHNVRIEAGSNVSVVSTDGGVRVEALQGIALRASAGAVVLSGSQIVLASLANKADSSQQFTLCVCASGRLYTVAANALCSSNVLLC